MRIARQLATRRWVGLTAVAIVLVVACGLLGRWQLGRAHRTVEGYSQEPAAASVDLLDSARHPLTAAVVNRQVLLSGRYDAGLQRLISGHSIGGAPVLWVVTPLTLTDGSTVEVVRGWVSTNVAALVSPPSSLVSVTGRIELLQPTSDASVGPGYASAIDSSLLGQLPAPARSGFVVRTAQSPPDPLSLQPVPSQAPREPKTTREFYLLSASYCVQWWAFGLIVIFLWFRLFRANLKQDTPAPPAPGDVVLTTPHGRPGPGW